MTPGQRRVVMFQLWLHSNQGRAFRGNIERAAEEFRQQRRVMTETLDRMNEWAKSMERWDSER